MSRAVGGGSWSVGGYDCEHVAHLRIYGTAVTHLPAILGWSVRA